MLASLGCSGGLNCGSCSNAYVYGTTSVSVPNGVRGVDDGVRMRLSQTGLDFLQENLKDILISQFETRPGDPNTLQIAIPDTVINASNPRVNLGFSTTTNGQGQPIERFPTNILINVAQLEQQLDFNFDDAANGIRLTIRDLPVGVDARVYGDIDFGIGTSDGACDVRGGLPGGFISNISFDILITPDVGRGAAQCDDSPPDTECLLVNVEVTSFALGGIEIDMINPGNCDQGCPVNGSRVCDDSFPLQSDDFECSFACGAGDFAIDAIAAFADFLEDNLNGIIRPLLENAINGALDGVDGAPIAASGRQDIAAAAPGILPESALDLGFSIGPTGNAFDVNVPGGGNLGMDMILKSGFEAAPALDPNELAEVPHPCVRPIEGVEFADLFGDGVRGEFEVPGNVDPLSGNFEGAPYHLGASLAKPALNQVMFSLYNTGALCLEINSDSINNLTGGAFQLSAATLDLLTAGKLKQFADPSAPAIVAISPSQPPVISYGAGTVDEGHIIVTWPDVEVSFYVLMFERFSRIFAVSADISLQIAVFNEPGTETLKISVVDGPNVENFVENYNELLPGVNFTEVLESLIGVAFDAALGDGLEFEYDLGPALSEALGIPIFIDFQGIETTPATDRQFLNVYLSMTDTQPQPRLISPIRLQLPEEPGVLRMSEGEDVERPTRAVIPTGQVFVDVDALESMDREFFARIDFGAWRGPLRAQAGRLVVKDAKLNFAGEHTITIRSRVVGEPNTLEAEGTAVSVWIDPLPPTVTVRRDDSFVNARGVDNATAAVDLLYSWQLDDNEPGEFAALDRLDLDDLEATRVSVRVKDRAGNIGNAAALDVRTEKVRLKDERDAAPIMSGGCSSSATGSNGGVVVVSGLALVLGFRRRRQR
ncbi:MAG: hypothetical protein Q8O67_20195 [Deltaproteobacteria bacterium]|nr:hypothetical protein [Deltaproteobacteria bacterium]